MQTLTELLLHSPLASRPFTSAQLQRQIEGTEARRHSLVNRALKAGELLQIRRGLYLLGDRYRSRTPHPFALAQVLAPGSYVSFETALAHHGWIPEAVRTIASVVPGRKSWKFEHAHLGSFSFHPLALQRGYFLELVSRQQIDVEVALVAQPVRALIDLVCLRKERWQGIEWLTEGMRIDEEQLNSITRAQARILKCVYKHKSVHAFLDALTKELRGD